MHTLFIACAVFGGVVLLAQLLFGALGAAHGALDAGDHDASSDHPEAEGLHLLSVRAVAAAVAFFGITGAALGAAKVPAWIAAPAALLVGGGAMVAVAASMRALTRLESDASVRLDEAIGEPGRVYLTIPAERAGAGKVHVTLRRRTVELQAVTKDREALPTGADVIVTDVVGPDTVEVVGAPQLSELLDDHS